MKTLLIPALRLFAVLTVVTGLAYPFVVTALAQMLMPHQASGSQFRLEGKLIGSDLLAQKFTSARYFQSRPSAADYATVASGASNQGPTSEVLQKAVADRASAWGKPTNEVPLDLLTSSGSGLDPHLSPDAVKFQVATVAKARGLDEAKVLALVESMIESPQFGVLGQARVNVLKLNLALDKLTHP